MKRLDAARFNKVQAIVTDGGYPFSSSALRTISISIAATSRHDSYELAIYEYQRGEGDYYYEVVSEVPRADTPVQISIIVDSEDQGKFNRASTDIAAIHSIMKARYADVGSN